MSALLLSACLSAGCHRAITRSSEVTLSFEGYVPDKVEPRAFFRMTNNTDEPFWFYGFDLQHPLFEIHRKTEKGWKQVASAFCATGAEPQVLGPGESTWIPLWLSPQEGVLRLQIGVASFNEPEEVELNSNEFQIVSSDDS